IAFFCLFCCGNATDNAARAARTASRKDYCVISAQTSPQKRKAFLSSWKDNVSIYIRIMDLLKPHLLWTWGAILCMGLSAGFALIVPWLLAWVVNTGLQHGQFSTLLFATAAILVASILRGLFGYGQGYLSQALSCLVAYDLRDRVYD